MVTSTPHVRMHHSSGVYSTENPDKENEREVEILIRHSQPKLRGIEGGARPKIVCPHVRTKETPTVARSLQLAAE